ncbi:cytochrome-c peroxidase [Polycladidibacter hongkongensis]|uniref:cytochrome-c peroxidase n=1 Tax=Polycladidibacter hongkongensis TaxID=1647556 RepID=UPI000830C6D4|nr:cytochrome c peroxidase [Pseudovibrio hongkongensis]
MTPSKAYLQLSSFISPVSITVKISVALIISVFFSTTSIYANDGHRDTGPFPREGECNIEDAFFARYKGQIQDDDNIGPGSLKGWPVPTPENLADFVKDPIIAAKLGKALFWDMQVGSDGVQACASCHFSAGADPRATGQSFVENLSMASFPFAMPNDPADRKLGHIRIINENIGSQGIVPDVYRKAKVEDVSVKGARAITARAAPSVINAVFYHRNFWDGRAEAIFNGVNNWGVRDPDARLAKLTEAGEVVETPVRIPNASLASLAVAPIVDNIEMSHVGRTTADIGRDLLDATPLAKQVVHAEDSLLGELAEAQGLRGTYRQMVKDAFQPQWWAATDYRSADGYTQIERNFSLFFGLAVREYLAMLVSDDSKLDRHFDNLAAGKSGLLNEQEKRGEELFEQHGCADCHNGPEFTGAVYRTSVTGFNNTDVTPAFQPPEEIERMTTADCGVRVYDQGFYNIGVTAWDADLGQGDTDPWGHPLSQAMLKTMPLKEISNTELASLYVAEAGHAEEVPTIARGEPTAAKGAFKIPTLRNVALTAPYFHNHGYATLRQVVQFYNRGGDFHDYVARDGIAQASQMDLGIGQLGMSDRDIDALVAFLETLTDERVLKRSAPFDGPSLDIPNGLAADGKTQQRLHLKETGRDGGEPVMQFADFLGN